MINKIKTYAKWIISVILAAFGIYVWSMKIKKQSDLNKTNKDIEDNNKKINDVDNKIKDVVDKKVEVVGDIKAEEIIIQDLKQEIKEVSPEPITDVTEAKENIIKKTKRRGRRPNKNNKTNSVTKSENK